MSEPEAVICPGCGLKIPPGIADYGRLWMWACSDCQSVIKTESREERP